MNIKTQLQNIFIMKFKTINFTSLTILCLVLTMSCAKDELQANDEVSLEESDTEESSEDNGSSEENGSEGSDEGSNGSGDGSSENGTDTSCDPLDFIFEESNGLLLAEVENNIYETPWEIETSEVDFSGEGYIVWSGQQYLSSPGNGLTTFNIKITNPGTYQFVWRSAVVIGNSGTDHNDSWLRFPDADDFYAQKGTSIVYPKGSGKTPNPAGAGADGWFKIWRSGGDLSFKWQAVTFDSNSHQIFVTFNSPGEYTMEISARSSGHAIDKFVLFQDSYSFSEATSEEVTFSEITCGN